MIQLKVIGEPEELKAALRTNRPIEKGYLLVSGSKEQMIEFAQNHPHLVEIVEDEKGSMSPLGSTEQESNQEIEEDKEYRAKSNKMLKKSQVAKFNNK